MYWVFIRIKRKARYFSRRAVRGGAVPVARRTHQITHVFLFAIRNSRYFSRRTDCLTYVTVPKIDEKTASLEKRE